MLTLPIPPPRVADGCSSPSIVNDFSARSRLTQFIVAALLIFSGMCIQYQYTAVINFDGCASKNTVMSSDGRERASLHMSILEEIMPASLLPLYQPKHLRFNVTRTMLQQSRPVIGNTQRLHSYLRKLQSKQCTSVLILGGSVTNGHQAGGPGFAYPRLLMDWLNARYPCVVSATTKSNGTKPTHVLHRTKGSNSQSQFIDWPTVTGDIESFDLVIVEFNVNDGAIPNNPHYLEDKSPNGDANGT